MAGGGPIPVREYSTADEMRRHAAEVRARLFAPRLIPVKAPKPTVLSEPESKKPVWHTPLVVEHQNVVTPGLASGESMSIADVVRLVALVTDKTKSEIISQQRGFDVVRARHIVCWLAARHGGMTLNQVGARLGGRDHTTVLYGERRVAAVIAALTLDMSGGPQRQARTLWAAEWPKVVIGPGRRPCAR